MIFDSKTILKKILIAKKERKIFPSHAIKCKIKEKNFPSHFIECKIGEKYARREIHSRFIFLVTLIIMKKQTCHKNIKIYFVTRTYYKKIKE